MVTPRTKIQNAMKQLDATFIQRTEAITCVWLALLTGQNFILVGDPGTAKTALVKACYSHISDARVFSVLCGSFATEDKIFGPTDVKAFQEGRWARATNGRLADCDLGFLDEMLKANDGTLNGMLTALNEREYEGGQIALRTCGAATNWPEVMSRSDNVSALWDRVLFRAQVPEVRGEEERIKLLAAVDKVKRYKPADEALLTLAELDQVRAEIAGIAIEEAPRRSVVKMQEILEGQKIHNSSRRFGALQMGLRASAWLDGRDKVLLDDFDALKFGLWTTRDQIDAVVAVVEACDQQVVNECLTKLRSALRHCKETTSLAAAPGLIKLAGKAATESKEMLEKFGARTKGKEQIKDGIAQLKVAYTELKARVKPVLETGEAT